MLRASLSSSLLPGTSAAWRIAFSSPFFLWWWLLRASPLSERAPVFLPSLQPRLLGAEFCACAKASCAPARCWRLTCWSCRPGADATRLLHALARLLPLLPGSCGMPLPELRGRWPCTSCDVSGCASFFFSSFSSSSSLLLRLAVDARLAAIRCGRRAAHLLCAYGTRRVP